MSISILILTLNEETNLSDCIDSVAWSDDIVVYDSFSTDATTDIAKAKGARVIQRKFDTWASHQNWALDNIPFKHEWVFYLDADERCTVELANEVRKAAVSANGFRAYRVRRKDFFRGRWLKHAQLYPTWLVRMFRPPSIRFERSVNPIPVVNGTVGELREHLNHFPFSHGITHWVARHNRYSDLEAIEQVKVEQCHAPKIKTFFDSDPNKRRAALKNAFYRMPARPLVKFFYYYFVRRGFLDGRPGLVYSILQSIYEYFIVLKASELKRQEHRD